jgi:hypothetical protein
MSDCEKPKEKEYDIGDPDLNWIDRPKERVEFGGTQDWDKKRKCKEGEIGDPMFGWIDEEKEDVQFGGTGQSWD